MDISGARPRQMFSGDLWAIRCDAIRYDRRECSVDSKAKYGQVNL